MSGGTAGGGSVRGTGAECRKFAPNIFNKSKCSSCFKQKEEHSAEALECNRSLNVNPKDSLLHGCRNLIHGKPPFAILSHDGDMRCATHRKSIRGDKNLILFVIHLFDEAYKRTSCVQDRALRRPLERREAGMMDGGAVNKMKRPESCLPLFGRHPLRDQLSNLTTRIVFSLCIIFRGRSLHYSVQSSRGLPRIIACLCLARLDNSSHQVGVAATVCKHCVCEYRFISRSSSMWLRCAEDDYLQLSRHNILPDLVLSMLPLSRSFVITTIYIVTIFCACILNIYISVFKICGCGAGNCQVNGSQASRGHFLLHFIALRLKWRQEKGVEISSEIIKTSSRKRTM
ncbi:Protein outspread [Trachymyrmex zeteki]|uniref:Protein outspread n=1 Tax=Mycetomoellerius zeteki TaxID=64791 RepID=A0A151X642_9HYME|nr:Protein outspread [Trachymyrmex zeteki]